VAPAVTSRILKVLKESGINFFAMFPCEKISGLYDLISQENEFRHVYLTREEEGVGICAGVFLAGARPAMLIQSSGIGNMVNALSSLTQTYRMPLLILASWRGKYDEKIPAQIPLGRHMPKLLEALEIEYTVIETPDDIPLIGEAAGRAYGNGEIQVVLLSPKLSEGEAIAKKAGGEGEKRTEAEIRREESAGNVAKRRVVPLFTRFEILQSIASFLDGKIVVCNLGIPCKELYSVKNQKSNFYMLGSMGLASPIGLGISLFTSKEVVVIDGDGSLMMDLGALTTAAREGGPNLTILAIDNGVHGSTGNQPTATAYGADLEMIARGSGFIRTFKAADIGMILSTLPLLPSGPNFLHVPAKPGNAQVPNVPLTPIEIRNNVIEAIANGNG